MPDKMIRPGDYEKRDLRADRVEFKPARQENSTPMTPTNREPHYSDRGSQPTSIDADSVQFRQVFREPTRAPRTANRKNEITEDRSHSAEILSKAVTGEYLYAILGLILGLAAIVGGIILGLHGVAGHTSWTAKVLGFESSINDAAPGVVLFVVGVFLVWITKPKVRLKDLKG